MNDISSIIKDIEDLIKRIENLIKYELSRYRILNDKLNEFARTTVREFYSEYDPIFYDRTRSLYYVFNSDLILTKDFVGIDYRFDASQMDGHHLSAEYLFDIVYTRGYHGGPEYRTPYGFWYDKSTYPVVTGIHIKDTILNYVDVQSRIVYEDVQRRIDNLTDLVNKIINKIKNIVLKF